MEQQDADNNPNSFANLFEKSYTRMDKLQPGQMVETQIVSISKDSIFLQLSGKSEGQKALFKRLLDPYRRSRTGWVALVLSRRSRRQERTRVGKVIEKILGDRSSAMDALVSTCVELRALRARRWAEGTLRAWLPLHVALVVVALGLAAVHVYAHARYR